MNRVLEHLAQDSDIDSDEDDESGSELSDNYQSDNDDNGRLVNLILCINLLNERDYNHTR